MQYDEKKKKKKKQGREKSKERERERKSERAKKAGDASLIDCQLYSCVTTMDVCLVIL